MEPSFTPITLALTFDDVLLAPRPSTILPADAKLATRVTRTLTIPAPLLSAAMDTVTEAPLAIALAQLGGLGVLHRNMDAPTQAAQVRMVKEHKADANAAVDAHGHLLAAAATSPGESGWARAQALIEAGVDVLVVDTAHGLAQSVLDMVKKVKDAHPTLQVMAGNVATAEGVEALAQAGADAIKVGIGPGSICTTRVVAGVGVPQLGAVLDCAAAAKQVNLPIIADGGIRYSGDMVKALAAGAAAVMLGSAFAGTDEAPGEAIETNGHRFRVYRGMGSLAAMAKGSAERYFQTTTQPNKLVPEGVEGLVPAKGPLSGVVHQFLGGLRAGMGYIGAATVADMPTRARFVQITAAGMRESHPHTLSSMQAAPNYAAKQA